MSACVFAYVPVCQRVLSRSMYKYISIYISAQNCSIVIAANALFKMCIFIKYIIYMMIHSGESLNICCRLS